MSNSEKKASADRTVSIFSLVSGLVSIYPYLYRMYLYGGDRVVSFILALLFGIFGLVLGIIAVVMLNSQSNIGARTTTGRLFKAAAVTGIIAGSSCLIG